MWRHEFLLTASLLVGPGAPPETEEPRQTIRRAIEAHGGSDNLSRLRAFRERAGGSLHVLEKKLPFTSEALLRMPDQFRIVQSSEVGGRKLTVVHVFDGKRGWTSEGGQTRAADERTLTGWRETAHATHVATLTPLLAADKGFELAALGESQVAGKPAVGVGVKMKGRKEVRLYFDKASGLLVKKTFEVRPGAKGEKGSIQEEVYTNFKAVSGVKRPMRITIYHDGRLTADVRIGSVEFLDKVDDKAFTKP